MSQTYKTPVNITFHNILDTEYTMQLREWRNQDFVRENMTNHDIIDEQEHIKYIESLRQSKTNKVFVAMNYEEPVAIVTIKINWEEGYVEPGTYIINEAYLGKGFGIVMSYFRLEYIFDLMPEGRMRTTILQKNERNINLQKKMGCEWEADIEVEDQNGQKENAVVLALRKQQWDANKKSIEERIENNFGMKNIRRIAIEQ